MGKLGESIHLFARILNVADAYRAIRSPRPFRAALKPYAAMECLVRQTNAGDVDSQVVRALLSVMSLFLQQVPKHARPLWHEKLKAFPG